MCIGSVCTNHKPPYNDTNPPAPFFKKLHISLVKLKVLIEIYTQVKVIV